LREIDSLSDQARELDYERRKLSAILNNEDAAFVVVDRDSRVIWANDLFRFRFTRDDIDPDDLRGMTCNQVLCGRSTRCDDCPCEASFQTGAVEHHELRLWLRDRSQQIYATAMPIESPDGRREQAMVMLQDVSGLQILKRSEEAFRASERRFRSIFDGVATGMVTLKTDGTFLQINPSFCTMLGYTGSELLGKPLVDVLPEEDRESMHEQLGEVLGGNRQVIEFEQRFQRRDGSNVWAHTHAVLQFEAPEKPAYLVCMIQDITQRKHAQEGLEKSKRRYQRLVNAMEGIVWEADADSPRYSFVSKRAEDILGFPIDRWLTQPRFWRNRLHPDDLQRAVQAYAEGVESGESFETEYRMIAEDGTPIWLRDTVTVAREEDGTVRLRGVMVDVTKRRNAEQALENNAEQLRQSQKMEAIGRLAGGIAHDFNNLLTTIGGYADFIRRGLDDSSPLRSEADEIERATQMATDLTGQLLTFSRQQETKPESLDLNLVVVEMNQMLARVIGEDIRLSTIFQDGLGAVCADPSQLQQVLLNLAVNARDAMPQGGELTIRTENVQVDAENAELHKGVVPGRYVAMSVSDTGHGIDAETQAHLFEPFFTTKEEGEGTGLGLATVYGVVTQSDGHIRVESEPGCGTTFTVYLPWTERESDVEPAAAVAPPEFSTGTETILLVEDDSNVRELARRILEMSGYMVIEAADGTEALAMCRTDETPVDLLATDLVMPHMGGRELAEKAAAVVPDLKVLFLSGYPGAELVEEGRLAPGSSFLQKPFTPAALSSMIRKILDGAPVGVGEPGSN